MDRRSNWPLSWWRQLFPSVAPRITSSVHSTVDVRISTTHCPAMVQDTSQCRRKIQPLPP